jgi:hypothetical protein
MARRGGGARHSGRAVRVLPNRGAHGVTRPFHYSKSQTGTNQILYKKTQKPQKFFILVPFVIFRGGSWNLLL